MRVIQALRAWKRQHTARRWERHPVNVIAALLADHQRDLRMNWVENLKYGDCPPEAVDRSYRIRVRQLNLLTRDCARRFPQIAFPPELDLCRLNEEVHREAKRA